MDKAADLECKSVKHSSPDSPQGSQSSTSSGKKIRTVRDNPKLLLPFKQGWRREVVQRGAGKDDHRPGVVRADAYYFSPDRKKLRSIIEVERYLKESGSTLDIRSFSFSRQPLGAGPQYEKVRQARPTTTGVASARPVPKRPPAKPSGTAAAAPASGAGSATAAAQNKVPKKRSSNRAITLGQASSVIQVPSTPGLPAKPQLPRKHSLMEKSRRAFAWKAMELKKKAPVFQNEPARPPKAGRAGRGRGRGRGRGGAATGEERIRVRRPWLLAEVDEAGRLAVRQPPDNSTTVEYFRLVRASASPHSSEQISIGQRRLVAPCSLFCFFDSPGSPMALPSVQCLVCRCLSHPTCVGLEPRCTSFICLGCYRGVCSGWGFDGVGDQLPADSGPDSDAASDVSVEEYIPPAPLGGSPTPITGGTAELLALSAGLGRGSMSEPRGRGMKRPRGRPRTAVPSPFAGVMGDLAVPRPARGRGSRGPRGARAALAVSLGRGAGAAAGESSRVSPAAPLVSAALTINTSSPVQATPKPAPVVSSGLVSPPGVAQGRSGAAGGAAGVRGPPLLTPRPVVRPAGSAGAPGRPATAQGPVAGGPPSGPRPAKKRSWK